MEPIELCFAKTKPGAIIPCKRDEDAGYDIYLCVDEPYLRFAPHETRLLPTGIASAFPQGYYFQLMERGSTGTKGIGQRCGVIDSGYRGEWLVALTNHNAAPLYLVKEEAAPALQAMLGQESAILYSLQKAVCQALLLPVPQTQVCELSYRELCERGSARMEGRLGSSGK
ncbi:MAG: dUTP pyrophosphatase [Clostridia bacterium]